MMSSQKTFPCASKRLLSSNLFCGHIYSQRLSSSCLKDLTQFRYQIHPWSPRIAPAIRQHQVSQLPSSIGIERTMGTTLAQPGPPAVHSLRPSLDPFPAAIFEHHLPKSHELHLPPCLLLVDNGRMGILERCIFRHPWLFAPRLLLRLFPPLLAWLLLLLTYGLLLFPLLPHSRLFFIIFDLHLLKLRLPFPPLLQLRCQAPEANKSSAVHYQRCLFVFRCTTTAA